MDVKQLPVVSDALSILLPQQPDCFIQKNNALPRRRAIYSKRKSLDAFPIHYNDQRTRLSTLILRNLHRMPEKMWKDDSGARGDQNSLSCDPISM